VTVIELLSPGNKVGADANDYLPKRREIFNQHAHLAELDLLVGGHRIPTAGQLPPGDYYAFVTRSPRLSLAEVYGWPIERPLPSIPIPLHGNDPDLFLDLAAVFETTYERGRYWRSIDYTLPPALPLGDATMKWVVEQARKAAGV
jgi:hypothetical protein